MRTITLFIAFILGLVSALYFGLYLMLIGGCVDIVKAVTTDGDIWKITVGIVKVLFSGVIGSIAFYVPVRLFFIRRSNYG